jgi:hypothetical protein
MNNSHDHNLSTVITIDGEGKTPSVKKFKNCKTSCNDGVNIIKNKNFKNKNLLPPIYNKKHSFENKKNFLIIGNNSGRGSESTGGSEEKIKLVTPTIKFKKPPLSPLLLTSVNINTNSEKNNNSYINTENNIETNLNTTNINTNTKYTVTIHKIKKIPKANSSANCLEYFSNKNNLFQNLSIKKEAQNTQEINITNTDSQTKHELENELETTYQYMQTKNKFNQSNMLYTRINNKNFKNLVDRHTSSILMSTMYINEQETKNPEKIKLYRVKLKDIKNPAIIFPNSLEKTKMLKFVKNFENISVFDNLLLKPSKLGNNWEIK